MLKELNKWSKYDVRNKMELMANIHSCLGNGYLETGDHSKALSHHTTDYNLATEQLVISLMICFSGFLTVGLKVLQVF